MATTVTATASAPKASSVIQLPTPPAGLQYYFSITVQTTRIVIAASSLADPRRLLARLLPVDGSSCALS